MDASVLDLILVEGFKQEKINKIVLFRQALGRSLDDLLDDNVIAIAADAPLAATLLARYQSATAGGRLYPPLA